MTFFQLINASISPLITKGEVFFLLEDTFEMTRSQLIASLQEAVPDGVFLQKFQKNIDRRRMGEPLAYILGNTSFLGTSFNVKPDVLIPRPETELLVLAIISYCKNRGVKNPLIIELGYGSGCILLSLALKLPGLKGYGWDVSHRAYEVASENQAALSCNSVTFYHGDFFENNKVDSLLKEKNLIFVSNPPYIPTSDISLLDTDVKQYESSIALDGGNDGLDFYRRCFRLFKNRDIPQFYEIGIRQKDPLYQLAEQEGYPSISVDNDYQGISRVFKLNGY